MEALVLPAAVFEALVRVEALAAPPILFWKTSSLAESLVALAVSLAALS